MTTRHPMPWPCRPVIDALIQEGWITRDMHLPASDCIWCSQFRWLLNDAGIIRGCFCGDECREVRQIYREPCIHPERRHIVPRGYGSQTKLFRYGVSP